MNTTNRDQGSRPDGDDKRAGGGPGDAIPKRPADTNAGGEARNDTGEDNQRQKGERPADDYIRR